MRVWVGLLRESELSLPGLLVMALSVRRPLLLSGLKMQQAKFEPQPSLVIYLDDIHYFVGLLVAFDIAKSFTVIVGLLFFGVLFALNSSLHSYLILAFRGR